mgnify:FL=1
MNKPINKLIKRSSINKQSGVYSIEFAIVGGLFFILLFAVLEVGRLFFVWNVLTEASRRGARLATVCNFNQVDMLADSEMITAALFNNVALVPNLTTGNLNIEYLQANGSLATDFVAIDLVKAEIVNYHHQMIIPGLFLTLNSPSFATTLPVESLGVTRWKYTQCLPSPTI